MTTSYFPDPSSVGGGVWIGPGNAVLSMNRGPPSSSRRPGSQNSFRTRRRPYQNCKSPVSETLRAYDFVPSSPSACASPQPSAPPGSPRAHQRPHHRFFQEGADEFEGLSTEELAMKLRAARREVEMEQDLRRYREQTAAELKAAIEGERATALRALCELQKERAARIAGHPVTSEDHKAANHVHDLMTSCADVSSMMALEEELRRVNSERETLEQGLLDMRNRAEVSEQEVIKLTGLLANEREEPHADASSVALEDELRRVNCEREKLEETLLEVGNRAAVSEREVVRLNLLREDEACRVNAEREALEQGLIEMRNRAEVAEQEVIELKALLTHEREESTQKLDAHSSENELRVEVSEREVGQLKMLLIREQDESALKIAELRSLLDQQKKQETQVTDARAVKSSDTSHTPTRECQQSYADVHACRASEIYSAALGAILCKAQSADGSRANSSSRRNYFSIRRPSCPLLNLGKSARPPGDDESPEIPEVGASGRITPGGEMRYQRCSSDIQLRIPSESD